MYWSLATFEVASASSSILAMFSFTHLTKSRAPRGVVEDEHRRALHGVGDHGALHAAGQVQHLHAAVVGRDQRALGRRHRDQELALGVLAVDRSGPAKPSGTWATPVKFSMLPFARVRVERVVRDVLQLGAGVLLDELLPLRDDLGV